MRLINAPSQPTHSSFLTHPLNSPSQPLSTSQPSLSIHLLNHPLNPTSQHTLITHPLNTPYHHTLSTHTLNPPSHSTVNEFAGITDSARRLLSSMSRRDIQQRFILAFIGRVICLVLSYQYTAHTLAKKYYTTHPVNILLIL